MEEDYVAAAVDRSSDRRSAIIYRVAHSEGGRNFDEILNGTAHGGTVVDKKESGPAFAHRNKKLLRFAPKNNTEIRIFSP